MPTKIFIVILACAAIFLNSSCSSTKKAKPLKLRTESHNLIIDKDNKIKLEKAPIQLNNLRQDLVKHLVFEKDFITVHVHQNVSQSFLDKVVNKLRQEGFKNLDFDVFNDPQ